MPAATSKDDLLSITLRDYAKLAQVIEAVPADLRLLRDGEDTSPNDILAHRAHWITLFLGWYHDGAAGKQPQIPAPGYKWNQLKAYNAALREAQSGIGWEDSCKMLDRAHGSLVAFISSLDDAALYGAPMRGGVNHWTPGRWAEASGASHYRSAAKYLRARQRQAST